MLDRFGIAIVDKIFPFRRKSVLAWQTTAHHQSRAFARLPMNGLISSRRDYDVAYRTAARGSWQLACSSSFGLLFPHRLRFLLAHVPAGSARVLRRYKSERRRDPLIGHWRTARTNLIGIHPDCGYRRAARYSALAPPNGVLARWDSMVRVRSRWAPGNDGACYFHPARCRGVLRDLRAAILFGLPACLHLDGSLRRTAFRGTRLDRLRAASLAAILWSFDRRPDSRHSVGSVAFAWIFNPLPGRNGYTSEGNDPRIRRVRPCPDRSAPDHRLGRQ